MVNILLEGYDFNAPWLYDDLKKYIKPHHKVAIVPFAFRDNRVKSLADWNDLYSKETGRFYGGNVDGFTAYGVLESNITFVNYFADTKESATEKIKNADIIHFLGGLPDRMMDRIREFDLYDTLLQHDGIVMGYSAGGAIQLAEYHLSPDEDYPAFGFYPGIPYLNDFYWQVHYDNTDVQNEAIQKVIRERGEPVYATPFNKGAIIVDNGTVHTVGEVYTFK